MCLYMYLLISLHTVLIPGANDRFRLVPMAFTLESKNTSFVEVFYY